MNSKISLFAIALIGLMFLSMPANAESGSITVSQDTNANYSDYRSIPGFIGTSMDNFTEFMFDTGNYTSLTNFTIYDPDNRLVFAQPNEIETFTLTLNGSGTGVASYSQFLHRMQWVFNSGATITGKPFYINYTGNHDIMRNVTYNVAPNGMAFTLNPAPATALNATMPMFPGNFSRILEGTTDGATYKRLIFSGIFSSGSVTNSYVITYPAAGFFRADISKTGQTINSKDYIHSQSNNSLSYYAEATFNNASFSALLAQTDGIYINVTLGTGANNNVLINASGISTAILPNASNPNAPNCNGYNCITTSKPTYNNTESENIFGSFYPATTTTTACLFFGFICTNKTINQESTAGYVFISTQGSTSPIKFLSFSPDLNNNYNIYTNLDIGTYQAQLFGFAAPGATCSNGIVYDFPFIPLGCYYPHNITTFSVVNSSGNLSIVWQTKISNSSAIYGDTITVAWTNVTANDTVVVYDNSGAISQLYNINQSTVNQIPVFIPLYTVGVWNATIYNGSNHNHNVSAFLNVLPPGAVDVNNSFGITMYWSKGTDVVNNPTQLNWNTGTFVGFYNISVLQDGNEIQRTGFQGVPGQSQVASYVFSSPGAFIAQFLDNNNTVQQQATIRIAAAIASSPQNQTSQTPDTSIEHGVTVYNNFLLLFTMPAVWGLIILIVVLFAAKKSPQVVNLGFAVAGIEAVFGLFDPFRWWVIAIVIIYAGIKYTQTRETVTGDK